MDVDDGPAEANAARKRVSTACEACRATKIKCQPSEQPGVCRKCLDSKKECISRTGPRTRRRRVQFPTDNGPPVAAPLPPPPGPSKTFTIDFDVPTQPDVGDSFATLREKHAQFFEAIFPPDNGAESPDAMSSLGLSVVSSPPSSTTTATHPIQSLHARPQFNADSAAALLASFRGMLPHFPCVALRPEDTVASLAATRPFVLLAILAAASGSRTLQGHSLYDEEFRKVLGLKFVAGGERSLELLQGVLIYCAWYPFHLRPRNRQAVQYVRMAGDLVHDLELDQETPDSAPGGHNLDGMRSYLAWYYSVSTYVLAWKKMGHLAAPYTPWTARCCDVLARNAESDTDLALSYLARMASSTIAAHDAIHESKPASAQQAQLVLLGLEAQQREFRTSMVPHIARLPVIRLADLSFDMYLDGGSLLRLARQQHRNPDPTLVRPPPPSPEKLARCVATLRKLLDLLQDLDRAEYLAFSGVDWSRFILAIILAVRTSFPLVECPGWDHGWARSELRLDEFLDRFCGGDGEDEQDGQVPTSTPVDVHSASHVVLRVVRAKYRRRLAQLPPATIAMDAGLGFPGASPKAGVSMASCPMFDPSMEPYISAWDQTFDMSGMSGDSTQSGGEGQPIFHDLWATMTMGWSNEQFED